MKKEKLNVPSKLSHRMDEYIELKINSIVLESGTTKTQVTRSLFNLGLNYFFSKGEVKYISDERWSGLLNLAQLNKAKFKLLAPNNCTITKIQENDLEKIGLIDFTGKGQAIRLVFHIGISEYDSKFKAKINPRKTLSSDGKEKISPVDSFDVARDLIHFNCFDKV